MNLKEFMRDVVLNWIKRRDNPHEVTITQAGGYTKEETDVKINTRLPVGVLPIYSYGTDDDTPINYNTDGGMVRIPDAQPVLFYGTPYTAPPSSLGFPPNGKFYITVELSSGVVIYNSRPEKVTDTSTRINIGEVEVTNDTFQKVVLYKARGVYAVPAPV